MAEHRPWGASRPNARSRNRLRSMPQGDRTSGHLRPATVETKGLQIACLQQVSPQRVKCQSEPPVRRAHSRTQVTEEAQSTGMAANACNKCRARDVHGPRGNGGCWFARGYLGPAARRRSPPRSLEGGAPVRSPPAVQPVGKHGTPGERSTPIHSWGPDGPVAIPAGRRPMTLAITRASSRGSTGFATCS